MKVAKKSMVFGASALFGAVLLALGLSLIMPATPAMAVPNGGGGSGCEGDVKIEDGPFVFEAPEGQGIEKVCIKAGTQIFTFECGNTGDGCYHIEWIYDGCFYAKAAIITGGGTSRYCKDISHVAATFIECADEN